MVRADAVSAIPFRKLLHTRRCVDCSERGSLYKPHLPPNRCSSSPRLPRTSRASNTTTTLDHSYAPYIVGIAVFCSTNLTKHCNGAQESNHRCRGEEGCPVGSRFLPG